MAAAGYPVVYQLIVLLQIGGSMTSSKLAKAAGRSVQTVSGHLAKLRAADVVRYDTAGKEVRYWLKHKGEIQGILNALHKVVHTPADLNDPSSRFGNSRNVEVPPSSCLSLNVERLNR
jgi:hypothetical protein